MKIAGYVDKQGFVAGFHEPGRICLYEESAGAWSRIKDIPFAVHPDLSLSELKAGLREAVAELGDCRVFVLREVRGLVNSLLLEEFGFRTWRLQGALCDHLDAIAGHDREFVARDKPGREGAVHACAAPAAGSGCGAGCSTRTPRPAGDLQESAKPFPAPVALGGGRYRIDLQEILAGDARLNSKEVLVPFMAGTGFQELEVLCDHQPRWFARELHKLKLTVAGEKPNDGGQGIRVLVVPL
jgi:Fe-only nitrogenase accessory protein AnfO